MRKGKNPWKVSALVLLFVVLLLSVNLYERHFGKYKLGDFEIPKKDFTVLMDAVEPGEYNLCSESKCVRITKIKNG